jgi:hypothetical protein
MHLATDKAIESILLIFLLVPIFMFGLHALVRIIVLDRASHVFQ